MAEATSAIREGVHPYLTVKGGRAARFVVNGAAILLSDDFPEFRGGTPAPAPAGVTIHLEVDNADAWWKRAVDAGGTIIMPLADQFWGDRYGKLKDPFGHEWSIASPVKK